MDVNKLKILEDITISNVKHSDNESRRFYSNAKLNIDGYSVELKSKYYKTIDDAVLGIKERISEAVIKFNPHIA